MTGILLTFVYAVYAHFYLDLSLGQIHLVATNFLFYWFMTCGIASIFWLTLVIICALFGISLFRAQTVASKNLIKYGVGLSALAYVSNIVKYTVLLFGTYLLHNSYYEGHLNRIEFAIGFVLVLAGVTFKGTIKRKQQVKIVTS